MKINTLTFETIDSTNLEALKEARLGAAEGLCIVAKEQTAGRGRQGRVWVSDRDAGLYFTILLRPQLDPKYLPLITLMAGVAVCDTLREFGLSPDIKWVNDLLIDERKVCGILAETTETPLGLAVALGIGINIRRSNFPPELAETVTSIEDASRSGSSVPSPEQLTQVLVNYLKHFYDLLNAPGGPETIRNEWTKRSTFECGKSVRVALDGETFTGVTDGIEENGALRVALADGSVKIVQAGDVQRLRTE